MDLTSPGDLGYTFVIGLIRTSRSTWGEFMTPNNPTSDGKEIAIGYIKDHEP